MDLITYDYTMSFLQRILQKKKEQRREYTVIQLEDEELRLWEENLESDRDTRIEEFWVESIGISEDGFWTLVGRRHGILQLYDWKGSLHKLPPRPPAHTVTDILFRGNYLALLMPPSVIIYSITQKEKPSSWKLSKLSQEGMRASSGLDIRNGTLVFGVVGERLYLVTLGGEVSLRTLDYKESNMGEVKNVRFIDGNRLLLGGKEASSIYGIGGNLIKRLPYSGVFCLTDKMALFGDENQIVLYDLERYEEVGRIDIQVNPASVDISPDGRIAFVADAQENKLDVIDLRSISHVTTLEGLGYSLVKISPDEGIYTCIRKEVEGSSFYYLAKFGSNLLDFYYPKERQRQFIKNAEKLYAQFQRKLQAVNSEEGVESMKEYRELLLSDAPIKRVRELISNAQEDIRRKKLHLFMENVKKKMENSTLTGDDVKHIEERIRHSEQGEKELLESLKDACMEHFEREIKSALERVRHALKDAHGSSTDEMESIDEIKQTKEMFINLPESMRLYANQELSRMVHEKLLENLINTYRIVVSEERVVFGKEEFERFIGSKRRFLWKLSLEDRYLQDGQVYVRVFFEREDGILREPKRYINILRAQELQHPPKWIKNYLRHLNGLFSYQEYRLPLFVSYEETPWFVRNLEKFTSLIKEQLLYREGILILEGDAGVGKNFLVEVFSALTNRPLYIIPCNSKMEKEDLTYMYEFDPKRGTKKVYSDLVKALQTPGAIVYFDEINTLPPSLVKMFNPLFDYRRYLVLSSGEVIKAERDVILLGGMNPQNYLGVSELPQDIKSRADILYIDYPPFESDGSFYQPDEAIILKDQIKGLNDLSKEDFTYLWYYVVNGVKTERGASLLSSERERMVRLLFDLLSIANAIRKAYRAYQSQLSEEPVEFVFSIRDTIRCARRLEKFGSAKESVLSTIIPKISSPLEREIVKDIVDRTSGSF